MKNYNAVEILLVEDNPQDAELMIRGVTKTKPCKPDPYSRGWS